MNQHTKAIALGKSSLETQKRSQHRPAECTSLYINSSDLDLKTPAITLKVDTRQCMEEKKKKNQQGGLRVVVYNGLNRLDAIAELIVMESVFIIELMALEQAIKLAQDKGRIEEGIWSD